MQIPLTRKVSHQLDIPSWEFFRWDSTCQLRFISFNEQASLTDPTSTLAFTSYYLFHFHFQVVAHWRVKSHHVTTRQGMSGQVASCLLFAFWCTPCRFRYGFKMVFRWCPFVHVGAESLNRRDNLTSRYSCSGSPDHNRIKRNGKSCWDSNEFLHWLLFDASIDTQKSILYTCPGSPKSHRVSHCGKTTLDCSCIIH